MNFSKSYYFLTSWSNDCLTDLVADLDVVEENLLSNLDGLHFRALEYVGHGSRVEKSSPILGQ